MRTIEAKSQAIPCKIAVVVSRFNETITERLKQGALERAQELGVEIDILVNVPGAVELPLTAQHLLAKRSLDAVICLGAVVKGETDHYEYVCQQASEGCQSVALSHRTPVIFGVLTTQNSQLALDRSGGKKGNKGAESIDAALEMIQVLREI